MVSSLIRSSGAKAGDFKDEVILRTYEALVQHYYLSERAVLTTLHTEMRYAGPRKQSFTPSCGRTSAAPISLSAVTMP
jgi:ATP sulfurylase